MLFWQLGSLDHKLEEGNNSILRIMLILQQGGPYVKIEMKKRLL